MVFKIFCSVRKHYTPSFMLGDNTVEQFLAATKCRASIMEALLLAFNSCTHVCMVTLSVVKGAHK